MDASVLCGFLLLTDMHFLRGIMKREVWPRELFHL